MRIPESENFSPFYWRLLEIWPRFQSEQGFDVYRGEENTLGSIIIFGEKRSAQHDC
jgi:hypothetical protein